MESAEERARRIYTKAFDDPALVFNVAAKEIRAAQEEARAEQRERDAKIAEDYEIGISFRGDEGPIYITGAKIAAAIRNQTQEEKDK